MELIAHTVAQGRQAIVLIPEIALTYQTVMRFYNRFGDRVSIMNSKLSQGERFDQFERAKAGDIDIMIGPRSALFTPFPHLGLIIIDEEHENSYKVSLRLVIMPERWQSAGRRWRGLRLCLDRQHRLWSLMRQQKMEPIHCWN